MLNNENFKIKKVIAIFGRYGCNNFAIASKLAHHFELYEIKNMTNAIKTEENKDLFRFMTKRDFEKQDNYYYIKRELNGYNYAIYYKDFKNDCINVVAVDQGSAISLNTDPFLDILTIYIEQDDKLRLIKLLEQSSMTAYEICKNFINDIQDANCFKNYNYNNYITVHNFEELIENEEVLKFIGV